jgi:NAD-dependent SIR2 family protein deacetylase
MGAGFASGKFAIALCDQCGQRYQLNTLIKDWMGFKVCPECYEPKHPQLEPKRSITEPQALYQPRPEARMGVTVYVGFTADTSFASIGMMPMPYAKPLTATGFLAPVVTRIT